MSKKRQDRTDMSISRYFTRCLGALIITGVSLTAGCIGDLFPGTNPGTGDPDYVISATWPAAPVFAGTGISVTFSVSNIGTAAGVAGISWSLYLSQSTAVAPGAAPADSGTMMSLARGATSSVIEATATWPDAGTWFCVLEISALDDAISTNNRAVSAAFTVGAAPAADYRVTAPSVPASGVAGDVLSGSFTITNDGDADGAEDVSWSVYISADNTLGTADSPFDSGTIPGLPEATESDSIGFAGNWPAAGDYYVFVVIESVDDDSPDNNEYRSAVIPVSAAPVVDYTPAYVEFPIDGIIDYGFTVRFRVSNVGSMDGGNNITWEVFLSTDDILDSGDTSLSGVNTTPALNGGGLSPAIEYAGTWPSSPGVRYLFIEIAALDESGTTGNNVASSEAIDVVEVVDYSAIEGSFPGTGGTGSSFSGSFRITNSGTINGGEQISWAVYTSSDATFDEGVDLEAQTGTQSPLNAGSSSSTINFGGTFPATQGTWYILVVLDALDDGNIENNVLSSAGIELIESGRFVVVGDSVNIYYSDDAAQSWTEVSSGAQYYLNSVATDGNGTWVAVGDTSLYYGDTGAPPVNICYSVDNAATWTQVPLANYAPPDNNPSWTPYPNGFSEVYYDHGVWIAAGPIGGGDHTTFYSSDGIHWKRTESGLNLYSVIYDPTSSRWLAGTDYNYSIYSTDDGANWSYYAGAAISPWGFALGTDGRRIVGVGGNDSAGYTNDGGVSWTLMTVDSTLSLTYTDVAFDGSSTWVAVGYTYPIGMAIYNSAPSTTWSEANDLGVTDRMLFGVAYDSVSSRFVAVGDLGTVIYSTNGGYDWIDVSSSTLASVRLYDIAVD